MLIKPFKMRRNRRAKNVYRTHKTQCDIPCMYNIIHGGIFITRKTKR